MSDDKFAPNEPLTHIIEFLDKAGEDKLASDVLDVFAKFSNQVEQYNLLAKLYLDLRNGERAESCALKVLNMVDTPEQKYACRGNLGKMYNNLNQPEKSIVHTEENLKVNPNNPDSLLEKVFSLYLLGRKDEAEVILRNLKANEHLLSEKNRITVNFNLGSYDMEQGKFLEGLEGFLVNVKKLKIWFSPRELPYQFWNGEAPTYPGRTIILFMEGGGIGDDFITVRWMDNLRDMGYNPIFYTGKPDVCKIFNNNGYKAVLDIDHVPSDSLWMYAMMTPIHLKVKPEEVCRVDYLEPTEQARYKWAHIGKSSKIRIGVRWQGNSKNERDLHRQVPLDGIMQTLKSVFKDSEVEYYSLQIDDGIERLADYPELIDVSKDIKSFDDTFAIVEHLDYVVTSCTSVLHAAAIRGVKTLGLVPISAYFTWLSPPTEGRPSNTSIWYPDNLRIFKQVKPKNWDEPFNKMKEFLLEDISQ